MHYLGQNPEFETYKLTLVDAAADLEPALVSKSFIVFSIGLDHFTWNYIPVR